MFDVKTVNFPAINTEQDFIRHYKSEFWLDAAKQACQDRGISHSHLTRPQDSEHVIFLIDDAFVIKFFTPFRRGFEREKTALEFAQGKTSLKIPEIIAAGNYESFDYIITTQLSGELFSRQFWLTLPQNQQIAVMRELAAGLKELHSHDAVCFNFDWSKFVEYQSGIAIQRQINAQVNPKWIEKLPDFIETNLKLLPTNCPTVFLHSDVHFGNLRFQKSNGKWRISGLFDFADSLCGFHEFDFLAIGLLMIQGQGTVQREFFKAYGYRENELDEEFRRRLMLMTVLYECSDLRRYALRLKPEAVNFSFEELEKAIWSFAN